MREFIKVAEQAVRLENAGLAWRCYDIHIDEYVFRFGKKIWYEKQQNTFELNGFVCAVPDVLVGIVGGFTDTIAGELDNAKLRLCKEIVGWNEPLTEAKTITIRKPRRFNPVEPRNDESTNIPKEVKSMVVFKDVLHVATTDGVFAKDRDGKFQRIFTP